MIFYYSNILEDSLMSLSKKYSELKYQYPSQKVLSSVKATNIPAYLKNTLLE
jgi:hypothetical protein